MGLGAHLFTFDKKWSSVICVENYQAGIATTEDYSNATRLAMNTEINSKTGNCSNGLSNGGSGSLEEKIDTSITGNAHLAWEFMDPFMNSKGRHDLISRSEEDLAGIVSIERDLLLFPSNSTEGTNGDALACL